MGDEAIEVEKGQMREKTRGERVGKWQRGRARWTSREVRAAATDHKSK